MTLLSRRGRCGRFFLVAAMCAWVGSPACAGAPAAAPRSADRWLDLVTLEQFRVVQWRPSDNYFKTLDPVRIVLESTATHERVVIEADDAEGTPDGKIIVRGHLRLSRPDGFVEGRAMTYRANDQTGEVSDARAMLGASRVRGRKIELLLKQRIKATDAQFTLCSREHPDFHLTAREIVIAPDGRVSARNIGFFVGGTRLFSFPSFSKTFTKQAQSPLPAIPGYTKSAGIQMRFGDDIVNSPSVYLDYALQLATIRSPEGGIDYERDLGKPEPDGPPPRLRSLSASRPLRSALEAAPALISSGSDDPEFGRRRASFYALLHVNQMVYNRKETDLRLSRLPEIGFAARNLLDRKSPESDPNSKRPPAESAFGKGVFSPAEWLINVEAGLGYLRERPYNTESARLGLRADATSPLFRVVDPVYFRYGGFATASAYGNGNAYTILSPEIEADVFLARNTLIGAAFRYAQGFGRTPFVFDHVDVRNEMRLRYGVVRSTWAYDLSVNYDMDRVRAYDTVFSVRRRFDCMEVGLSYQTRAQSVGLIFNLLGTHQSATAGQSGGEAP